MDTPCIEWTQCKTKHGYGRKNVRGKQWKAHRWAWTQKFGEIPKGLGVLHRCNNPACYNTDHLYLGTQKDNARDMDESGRRRKNNRVGALHPMAKLNDEKVEAIRLDSRKYHFIAADYGISVPQISAIKTGRLWKRPTGRLINGVFVPLAGGVQEQPANAITQRNTPLEAIP